MKFTQKILNKDFGDRSTNQIIKMLSFAIAECMRSRDFDALSKIARIVNTYLTKK